MKDENIGSEMMEEGRRATIMGGVEIIFLDPKNLPELPKPERRNRVRIGADGSTRRLIDGER